MGCWFSFPEKKTCRKNIWPPEDAPSNPKKQLERASLKHADTGDTGQCQSPHGCFSKQFSINCVPWKSTVSSALDFHIMIPFLRGRRVSWDAHWSCMSALTLLHKCDLSIIPSIFLNIEIYISLIYIFHFP